MPYSMRRAGHIAFGLGVIGAAVLGLWLRAAWLEFRSADMVSALLLWYDYLALGSGIDALRFRIGTYSPPYLYVLAAFVQLREAFLPSVSPVATIKLLSFLFDALAAWRMYALVRLRRGAAASLLAASLVWLAPTVWLNSAVWGQCDVVFAVFVLWSLSAQVRKRAPWSALAYGVALSFKAQAAFAAPAMAYLWLKRRLALRDVAIGAAAFLVALAPAMLVGAPVRSTLLAYLGQAGEFRSLTMLAPNLYGLIPVNYFEYATAAGLIVAALLCAIFAIGAARYGGDATPAGVLGVATFGAVLAPFALPGMHERYFFLADLISIAFAFYRPRYFWVPIALQLTSGNAYLQYFDLTAPGVLPAPALAGLAPGLVNAGLLAALGLAFLSERYPRLEPVLRRELGKALAATGAAIGVVTAALIVAAPAFRQPNAAMSLSPALRALRPVSITFGDAVEVVAIDYVQDRWLSGRPYDLRIHARALKPLSQDLALRLDFYDALGRSLGIGHTPALALPTSSWTPGRVFVIETLVPIYALIEAPTLTTVGFQWFEPGASVTLPITCGGAPCDGKAEGPPIELNMDDTRPLRGDPRARFGDAADLITATLTAPQSGAITVTLVWRARIEGPATLAEFIHVLGADGRLVSQSDGVANNDRFPTPAWRKGQFVVSSRRLRLPEDLPSASYRVTAGLYRSDTQVRVPVTPFGGASSADDAVEVGTFIVAGTP